MVTLLKNYVDCRLFGFMLGWCFFWFMLCWWVVLILLDVLVGLVVVLVYFVLMGCSDLCCIGWTLLDWLGFWLCYDGLEDGQGLP